MSRTYDQFRFTFKDKTDWVLPRVLEHRAKRHADKPCLQYMASPPLSYAEVNRTANRIAHGLSTLGLAKGDRIAIMLPNCLEYLYVWFACNKLGAIEVPVNTAYKGYFLEHTLNNSGAKLIVVHQDYLPALALVQRTLASLEVVVIVSANSAAQTNSTLADGWRTIPFEELLSDCCEDPRVEVSYRDLSAIMYTSGTTGPSKGVMMPHAQCYVFSEECINLVRLTDRDTYYTCNPLFHANAQMLTVYPVLIKGAKLVLYPSFSASHWIDQIRSSGATVANFLGVMMDFVFRQAERPDDSDNQLRVLFAAPTPASIAPAFKRRFGVEQIVEVYGMTETTNVVLSPYDQERPPGACGKILADLFEVRIADPDTDEDVPAGQIGECLVRHKIPWTLNSGYYGMPEKTAEAYRNLWFHTGDALRVDSDGWCYFIDRIKDAVRRRGENISSFEIEKVIGSHEGIAECAVVAIKSEVPGGEDEVKACIVFKPGQQAAPEELLDWCEHRMPYFAVPRYLEFVSELPKTPNLKVQKEELRAAHNAENCWDRVRAGYQLQEEIKKALKKQKRLQVEQVNREDKQ